MVSRVRFPGRGGSSGIEVDRSLIYVQELGDGKLLRQRPFETEDGAFSAAGLARD